MKNLQSEFDNGELEHFTYYDYVKQVSTNGIWSSLKTTLEELDDKSLIILLTNNQDELRSTGTLYVADEIMERMQ
ncbi:MAG: hypothetical protein Unbinned1322contig1000_10 [Prokaryotic dsDNA virus sp.]|nr:hypothetical protein [Aequorivita sp.]QDP57266.1 MAG: hypothetical protein Unbinned1322contig1000_10 [Prokaryotic dsDNA virus sp.]|tara:strand:+ start:3182 stop:3406 length:225 start_codon:yes stop_codon:yes gene_type:complete